MENRKRIVATGIVLTASCLLLSSCSSHTATHQTIDDNTDIQTSSAVIDTVAHPKPSVVPLEADVVYINDNDTAENKNEKTENKNEESVISSQESNTESVSTKLASSATDHQYMIDAPSYPTIEIENCLLKSKDEWRYATAIMAGEVQYCTYESKLGVATCMYNSMSKNGYDIYQLKVWLGYFGFNDALESNDSDEWENCKSVLEDVFIYGKLLTDVDIEMFAMGYGGDHKWENFVWKSEDGIWFFVKK